MSKKLKLSQWHDGSVNPVHVGVYNVDDAIGKQWFSFWDGKKWNGHWDIEKVLLNKYFGSIHPDGCSITTKWRGIVK